MNAFTQLQNALMTWRYIGHGLWPVRNWPDSFVSNYVMALQQRCCVDPLVFFHSDTGKAFIHLIRYILDSLPPADDCPAEDPRLLLETILFALIGLLYPEEPGELTIEEVLAGY